MYIDKDGNKKTPILVHRTIYGSWGRFMGLLIEHLAGKLPVWLSPVHAVIIPISDRCKEYADSIVAKLQDVEIKTATAGLRIKKDYSSESMQKKIRNAQLQQIPYMIIVGDKELESQTISIRRRDGKQEFNVQLDDFIQNLRNKIKSKDLDV